jgi:hypothetical protein
MLLNRKLIIVFGARVSLTLLLEFNISALGTKHFVQNLGVYLILALTQLK